MVDIIAYCDASYSKETHKATACSIIMSDMMFHEIKTGMYEDVITGSHAELLGVIQTMEIISKMKDVNSVTLYCDSKTTMNLYQTILKLHYVKPDTNYYQDWLKLLNLSRGLTVAPHHIYGHASDHNINKVCDYVANSALKMVVM